MRYIQLTPTEEQKLASIYKQSAYLVERQRSQCLLLSNQGKTINELAGIFQVSRLTITHWLDKWQQSGLDGVGLQPGRGRKKKLAGIGQEQLKGYVESNSRNLNAVVALIEEKHAVVVAKKTLQRFLKT